MTERPEPRFEACHARGLVPATVRYISRDAHGRRCTQFVATCDSSLRDNNRDAEICAKALAEAYGVKHVVIITAS